MKPHVIWNTAMSLDGVIGVPERQLPLSNQEDKKRVQQLRREVDAIMVGIGTVLGDDPKLTAKGYRGRQPLRVIVDSKAQTPLDAEMFSQPGDTLLAVTDQATPKNIARLEEQGAEVVVMGEGELVDVTELMYELSRRGVTSVLHEGGGTLNASMVEHDLIDEIYVTVCPTLQGRGTHLLAKELPAPRLIEFIDARILDGQVVLHYEVKK